MDTGPLIITIIGVIAVALAIAIYAQKHKTNKLRKKFGPEYDHVVALEHGRARRAEAILEDRQKRVDKLSIRHLTPVESDQFTAEWRLIQEQFVDNPTLALQRAENLVNRALRARGYPMTNYQQGVADLSVGLPLAVDHYRVAHEIAERHATGRATTEELRRAMQNYRDLFENVLEAHVLHPATVLETAPEYHLKEVR